MRHTALHWTIAMTCFALGAVAACSSESATDLHAAGTGAPGATGSSDIVGSNGKSTSGGGAVETTASGLPCDVDKVLKSRCQTCHGSNTQFGASAPLVTHDDLVKSPTTA
jgi:hypothetical protein